MGNGKTEDCWFSALLFPIAYCPLPIAFLPSPMIHPAPTTKIDPTLARGTVVEVHDANDAHPAQVVLSFPNTSYQTTLEIEPDLVSKLRSSVGELVTGRIIAQARRVDQPQAGGRKIDPCYGTPTRVMGTVVGIDPIANVLVVDAGAPILLTLTAPGQSAKQFADAAFVASDILPGARFTLVSFLCPE